jgi:hypothetical protein
MEDRDDLRASGCFPDSAEFSADESLAGFSVNPRVLRPRNLHFGNNYGWQNGDILSVLFHPLQS